MSGREISYWMVQPDGRRRFRTLAEAETTATIINNAIDRGALDQERVNVMAYDKSGKVLSDATLWGRSGR